MNKLRQKRRQVLFGILAVVVGNSFVVAIPSFEMETTKKLFLTFANVVMFIIIWDAYFEEKLAQKGVRGILQDLLTITATGTVTTFIISKVITKAIAKLITAWGTFGWGIAGAIAGITTAILGIMWAFYCDDLYRNSAS